MAVDFTAWLVDPTAIRCILIEAVSNVSGVDQTRYLSTKTYTDNVAARIYSPIVSAGSVQLIERMSIDSSPSMSYGDIDIMNIDGALDSWLLDIWTNKAVTILAGDVRWLRADFTTIFSGIIEDIDSRSANSLNIKFRDKLQQLNTPLSETTLGGSTTNKNELVPLCFGETFNITPLLSNPATLEYLVNGATSERIIEVRDNGVPVSITPTLATGKFTLGFQSFGQVTASIQGTKSGGVWLKTISSLIQHIATTYGGSNKFVSGDLDAVQLAAFESANTQAVGLYTKDRENTLVICNQLAASVGAQPVMSRLGKLQLLKLDLPPSGTPFEIGVDDIVANSIQITRKFPIRAAVKINYDKNWTVQPGLLTGIPNEHKKMYATEFLDVVAQDAIVKAAYKVTAEPIAIDTLLLTEADATAEATRLLNLFKVPRFIVSFTGTARLIELILGQGVNITFPRFGMNAGKTGQVIGLSIDWNNFTVNVEAII